MKIKNKILLVAAFLGAFILSVCSIDAHAYDISFIHMDGPVNKKTVVEFVKRIIREYPYLVWDPLYGEHPDISYTGEKKLFGEHVFTVHVQSNEFGGYYSAPFAVSDSGKVFRNGYPMDASRLDSKTKALFSKVAKDIYGDGKLKGLFMMETTNSYGDDICQYGFFVDDELHVIWHWKQVDEWAKGGEGIYIHEPSSKNNKYRVFHNNEIGYFLGQNLDTQIMSFYIDDDQGTVAPMYSIIRKAVEYLWEQPYYKFQYEYMGDVVCGNRMMFLFRVSQDGETIGDIAVNDMGMHVIVDEDVSGRFIRLNVHGGYDYGYVYDDDGRWHDNRTLSRGDEVTDALFILDTKFLEFASQNLLNPREVETWKP